MLHVWNALLLLALASLGRCVAEPVNLLLPDASHSRFVLNEAGLAKLAAIQEPVAVVSCIGPYRSGKSFLLNMLLGQPSGFELGGTVNPVTLGIWFMDPPPLVNGNRVIFLDTEGLYSPHVPANYDAKMFSLALIFSSTLIYNELGVLNQQSVDRFQYLTFLTLKFLEKMEKESGGSLRRPAASQTGSSVPDADEPLLLDAPNFLWVLEDFFLELGNQTPEQWLQKFFRDSPASDSGKQSKSAVSDRTLRLFGLSMENDTPMFRNVSVRMLSLPHYEQDKMLHLDRLREEDLLAPYRAQMEQLRRHVLATIQPKSFNKHVLTGKELAGLLRVIVDGANTKDRFPPITSAWELFLQLQNAEAVTRAQHVYVASMGSFCRQYPPVAPARLPGRHQEAQAEALSVFARFSVAGEEVTESMRHELLEHLRERFEQYTDSHFDAVQKHCSKHIELIVQRFDRELSSFAAIPRRERALDTYARERIAALTSEGAVCSTGGSPLSSSSTGAESADSASADAISEIGGGASGASGSGQHESVCSPAQCEKLTEQLVKSHERVKAENFRAVVQSCRAGRDQGLALFQETVRRRALRILSDEELDALFAAVRELALRRYASLAAVEESERSTEEFYLDLEEKIAIAEISARNWNGQKAFIRRLLGYSIGALALLLDALQRGARTVGRTCLRCCRLEGWAEARGLAATRYGFQPQQGRRSWLRWLLDLLLSKPRMLALLLAAWLGVMFGCDAAAMAWEALFPE